MKWFLDLTTRTKLFVSFALMIAFLATVIVTAYAGITAIQESQKDLYQKDFANALDLMTLRSEQNGVRTALLSMMAIAQRSDQETWHQEVKERSRKITAITQRLLERNRRDPHLAGKLEELAAVRDAFAQTRDAQLIPLVYAGKVEEARALAFGVQEERYRRMREISEELGNDAMEKARAAVAASEQRARQAVQLFVVAGIVAILLALMMVLFLNRIIAEPLRMVSGIAERVASGDLTVDVPQDNRADEVGGLVRTFRTMIESQRRVMQEILGG